MTVTHRPLAGSAVGQWHRPLLWLAAAMALLVVVSTGGMIVDDRVLTGLPIWTTLIGLKHRDAPLLGSIGQPFLDEVFIGHAGASRLIARGQAVALKTRPCPTLAEAMIATTDPALFNDQAQHAAWTSLRAAVRLARLGCDAYAYAMVAAGALDLVIETGLKSWDIEAARALLAGAGGIVADWRGEPIGGNGGQMLIAGDRTCLGAAAALLKDAAA